MIFSRITGRVVTASWGSNEILVDPNDTTTRLLELPHVMSVEQGHNCVNAAFLGSPHSDTKLIETVADILMDYVFPK